MLKDALDYLAEARAKVMQATSDEQMDVAMLLLAEAQALVALAESM